MCPWGILPPVLQTLPRVYIKIPWGKINHHPIVMLWRPQRKEIIPVIEHGISLFYWATLITASRPFHCQNPPVWKELSQSWDLPHQQIQPGKEQHIWNHGLLGAVYGVQQSQVCYFASLNPVGLGLFLPPQKLSWESSAEVTVRLQLSVWDGQHSSDLARE